MPTLKKKKNTLGILHPHHCPLSNPEKSSRIIPDPLGHTTHPIPFKPSFPPPSPSLGCGSSVTSSLSEYTSHPSTTGNGHSTLVIPPHHLSPYRLYHSTVIFRPSSNLVLCSHPSAFSFDPSTAYRWSLNGRSCVYFTQRARFAGSGRAMRWRSLEQREMLETSSEEGTL
jgi:hypothetical protein